VRQEAILGEIVVEELKDPTGGVPIEASQDVNAASDSTSQSA